MPDIVRRCFGRTAQAHADLLALPIRQWPDELLAARAWELRHNLSIYDASCVALAELTDAALVALDERIGGAPDPRCLIITPRSHRDPQIETG